MVDNTAGSGAAGGGIGLLGTVVSVTNSVLANSVDGGSSGADIFTFSEGGVTVSNSFIKDPNLGVAPALVDGVDGVIVGTDPKLGALGDNGGVTVPTVSGTMVIPTRLPAADSPVVDQGGTGAPPAYDQRGTGYDRVVNSLADWGAIEVQGAPSSISVNVTPNPSTKTIAFGATTPTFAPAYSVTPFTPTTAPTCAIYQTGTSTLVTASPIPAGTYDTKCSGGTPGDGYSFTYATGSLTVGKATPTCTVTGYAVTYDGSPHSATGSCKGYDGTTTLTGLDLSGTAHSAAGTYASDPWTFTDASGNYSGASGTVNDIITPATTNVVYSGTRWVPTAGTTMTPSVSGVPAACTGPVAYALDVNPLTGAAGPYSLTVTSGSVSTAGWQPGAYLVTATYADDASCTGSYDITGLTVGVSTSGSAWGGGYSNYSPGRGNFGFEVQTVAKTAITPSSVKGQLVWVQKNGWKFKGTLSSYSVATGTGSAKGTGNLFYWKKSGSGGSWVAATTGTATVTITFAATTPATKIKAASPGAFGITVAGTKAAGVTSLPNYAMSPIAFGNITMNQDH
jgi:hypothetical protein